MPGGGAQRAGTWICAIAAASPKSALSPLLEQAEVNRITHRLVAGVAGMEKVSRVILLLKLRRRVGVADSGVEIDHAVVGFAVSDPVVDGLPLLLTLGGPIAGAFKRCECRAIDDQSVRVGPLNQLFVTRDNVGCAGRGILARVAD